MNKKDLRIVFMGTPEFALGTLKALVENSFNVVAVVTGVDKARGRHGSQLQPTVVKTYALEHNIPVLQPVSMKDEGFIEALFEYKPDIQVVVAFRMLPKKVWSMPRFGTFNVHASLLPQYRGAAPINWVVINGETETGVTTFFLDEAIDTGHIISQRKLSIPDDADVEYVYDNLMKLGADLAVETLENIAFNDGKVDVISQDALLSKQNCLHDAPKIFKDTCKINWNKPSKRIYDFIRGLSPYPAAWSYFVLGDTPSDNERTLKIYRAAKTDRHSNAQPGTIELKDNTLYVNTVDNQLQLLEVQLGGKRRMDVRDFLNGMKEIERYSLV